MGDFSYRLRMRNKSFLIPLHATPQLKRPSFLPAHIFVQQPGHHTFHQIHRLEECMNHVYAGGDSGKQYGDCSLAESELQELLVCVCRWGVLPSQSVIEIKDYGGCFQQGICSASVSHSDN